MKVAVLNQKGGVGKTTVSVNLAYGLAQIGKKTLLADLDPQANSTRIYHSGTLKNRSSDLTVRDLLLNKAASIRDAILTASVNGQLVNDLSLIPSNIHLATTAEQIIATTHKEKLLHNHFRKIEKEFDFVVMDCPPTLNVLTVNAIYTADLILIVTNYGVDSLNGIADLFKSIADVKESDDFSYRIVRNGYDARNKTSNEFIEQELEPYRTQVMKTFIRDVQALNQAPMNKEPIFIFAPTSKGAEDFQNLTSELIAYAD